MSTEQILMTRSESKCELCSSTDSLAVFPVPPTSVDSADESVLLCENCIGQINNPETVDVHHWRCLNDSMWSQVPAVQVMSWRMLTRLGKTEGWAQDAVDMMYLEEDIAKWAQATGEGDSDEEIVRHLDSNGALLEQGDNVTLIKDLNVKGTSFVAKRGTVVRGIGLVSDNAEHIEGRVNGTRIVILTQFVKKSA
jgi:protein PhnA